VAEDGNYGYYHQVTAPSGGTAASSISITTVASTASTPVGQYTGANGLTYGGVGSSSNILYYSILKPVLTLTRTSTVDAPIVNNPVGYTGGIHDAVPGSIITYSLSSSNTGNISAESVIIVDMVPANTYLAHVNVSGSTTNVNITPSAGTGGWTVSYSTLDNPNKSYGVTTGWTLLGSSPPYPSSSTTYSYSDGPYNAKWLKFEMVSFQAETAHSITWGATIR
jgi:uncharacterized repeat protein (TIGR01451 family)